MCKHNHSSQHICLWCLKPLYHDAGLFDLFLPLTMLCHACQTKIPHKMIDYSVEELQGQAMMIYDQEIEQILFRYKEDGDLPLAPSFFFKAKKFFKKHKDAVFVLMPSSKDKTKERGFHALETMVSQYTSNYCLPLEKTVNIKQSQQSAAFRKRISQSIILTDASLIQHKKVILLDDVCTTGNTLLAAYNLVKPYALSVQAFTFSVSSKLFQNQ